jgi:hypothetical protein
VYSPKKSKFILLIVFDFRGEYNSIRGFYFPKPNS